MNDYKIKKHFGVVSHATGWRRELNLVHTSGEDKISLCWWSKDHAEKSRDFLLSLDEWHNLLRLYERSGKLPITGASIIKKTDQALRIYKIVGVLSPTQDNTTMWYTMTSWSEGQAKHDIRRWEGCFQKAHKGVVLADKEMQLIFKISS